jgi:hypothetical protein
VHARRQDVTARARYVIYVWGGCCVERSLTTLEKLIVDRSRKHSRIATLILQENVFSIRAGTTPYRCKPECHLLCIYTESSVSLRRLLVGLCGSSAPPYYVSRSSCCSRCVFTASCNSTNSVLQSARDHTALRYNAHLACICWERRSHSSNSPNTLRLFSVRASK